MVVSVVDSRGELEDAVLDRRQGALALGVAGLHRLGPHPLAELVDPLVINLVRAKLELLGLGEIVGNVPQPVLDRIVAGQDLLGAEVARDGVAYEWASDSM